MSNFPCKDCITLAICKNKTLIDCSILFDYLISVGGLSGISNSCFKIIGNFFGGTCIHLSLMDGISSVGVGKRLHLTFSDRTTVVVFEEK